MSAGRPPKYETPEELEQAVEEYFAENPDYPTQSGLALALGFADRQSLYDYKAKDKFSCTIKRALQRIDEKHERRLYENANSGSIFYLKNRGWSDSLDVTSKGDKLEGANIIINSQGKEPEVE